jgi:hypothetical protein
MAVFSLLVACKMCLKIFKNVFWRKFNVVVFSLLVACSIYFVCILVCHRDVCAIFTRI